jgi:hypothetical protein
MKIIKNSTILIIGLLLFSCTEDKAILIDDNYINTKVPVNTDYTVGAIYRMAGIASTLETPSEGKYSSISIGNYAKHMEQAKTAGVDFFIFNLRWSGYDSTQQDLDKGYIDISQNPIIPNNNMKFAISYDLWEDSNIGNRILSNTQRIDVERKDLKDIMMDDFRSMERFFKNSNYMKITINGKEKAVVYMKNSFNLYAKDNPAVYQELRDEMKKLDVELYLIGMQTEWTPPLRYDFRFVGCVDALTVTNYANINKSFYDRFYFFHKYIDLAWSYHKETFAKYNIEFIPTISPSYNSPLAPNYDIAKNADWFKANCNIARRASGANKLVIIDSFNDWNLDTQIESATSYGDEYLKILKPEFKVN